MRALERANIPPLGKTLARAALPEAMKPAAAPALKKNTSTAMNDSSSSNARLNEPLRIFIAAQSEDDAGSMAQAFESAGDITITGTTTKARAVDAAFKRGSSADVLICDVTLEGEDMAPILETIKRAHPTVDILIVSACSQDAMVIRAVLAGATGYILKDSQEDLLTSVRLLRGGGSPVSPTVARSVLRAIHARTINQPDRKSVV